MTRRTRTWAGPPAYERSLPAHGQARTTIHRIRCAAITNGCTSSLVWEDNLPSTQYVNEHLALLNGWRKDHGEWICGNHPAPDPTP
jgi:hypothetical protein